MDLESEINFKHTTNFVKIKNRKVTRENSGHNGWHIISFMPCQVVNYRGSSKAVDQQAVMVYRGDQKKVDMRKCVIVDLSWHVQVICCHC